MESKNPIQVSERIFSTIEILAAEGALGLLELSSRLELNKSTVHRILNSLIHMEYAKQDPVTSKYSLTFKFCQISNQILNHNNMIDLAKPVLRQLSNQTKETIHLVEISGTNAIYIDKMDAQDNPIRLVSMVGKKIPLFCSGVGKALLAEMSDEEIDGIWNQSDIFKMTEKTITDYSEFCDVIKQIRANGYAYDDEENEVGVKCVAVALHDFEGNCRYAISISAPKDRMQKEQQEYYIECLLAARNKLEKSM